MKTIFAMGCVALLSGCPGDPMAGTITVGAVLSLTGELADIGAEGIQAIQLAVEQINLAGGAGGSQLALIYKDDASDSARSPTQAQALITEPKVILMDEPFSALDIHTRHLMQNELLRLWQEDRRAVVMITHDLEEAIALGDRVVVLAAGPKSRVIESFPVDLERPRNVAEIKLDPKFMTLYRDIWASLRGEVEKSYASR